jgi:LPXTG-site transpeptidase (sortase) family protein
VTVEAQSVTDVDFDDPPDNMLMDQTISFVTEANPEKAPEITLAIPANGATDVAVNSNITLTFSENISGTVNWAGLECSVSGKHSYMVSGTSQTPVINPDIDFANNESCTLTVLGSQIHDLDEKDPPDEMTENFSLTFSTSSPTDQAPTVVETYPSNLAVGIPVDRKFSITFSEAVDHMLGWINFSCKESGVITVYVEDGPIKYTISSDKDFKYNELCTVTLNANKIFDMDKDDPPDFMGANFTFSFTTMQPPVPTIVNDEAITPHDGQLLHESLNHLFVKFNKDVLHDGSSKAVDNAENYRLLKPGMNNYSENTDCDEIKKDESIPIGDIVYKIDTFTADLTINYGANLPNGTYRLIICGTQTITDLDGTPLNDGANSIITFTINTEAVDDPTPEDNPPDSGTGSGEGTNTTSSNNSTTTGHSSNNIPVIPVTGFRHGEMTLLPPQLTPYADPGDLWLEVSDLDLKTSITGVPKKDGTWDVTWLGNQVGWLGGSALPGLTGNSVLTAHVWDALNRPGPFYGMEKLEYGDQVILHAWGDEYVYEVREVLSVKPENVNSMMKHQEKAWLTLVTCQGYDEDSGEYRNRVLVRAVLKEVR